jgi:hypothetical protein
MFEGRPHLPELAALSEGGGSSPPTFFKLFSPAHASSNVPSTVKCSSEIKCWALGLIQLLNFNSYRDIARDYPRGCLIMN